MFFFFFLVFVNVTSRRLGSPRFSALSDNLPIILPRSLERHADIILRSNMSSCFLFIFCSDRKIFGERWQREKPPARPVERRRRGYRDFANSRGSRGLAIDSGRGYGGNGGQRARDSSPRRSDASAEKAKPAEGSVERASKVKRARSTRCGGNSCEYGNRLSSRQQGHPGAHFIHRNRSR